jgi:hypothetical protein
VNRGFVLSWTTGWGKRIKESNQESKPEIKTQNTENKEILTAANQVGEIRDEFKPELADLK